MKKISERLKTYRLDHNLTQFDMAKELHVSVTTYNHLENGHTAVNTKTVDKLSKLLEMPVDKVRKCL